MSRQNRLIGALLLASVLPTQAFGSSDDPFLETEHSESSFTPIFETTIRYDDVKDLPRPVESDFDRTLGKVRLGFLWTPNENVEVGLVGKLNQSSQRNSESLFNLDNERADDFDLDDAYVSVSFGGSSMLQLGQSALNFSLTQALWDDDLRPRGLSISKEFTPTESQSVNLGVGYFDANHTFNADVEFAIGQLNWRINEGESISFSTDLAYIEFDQVDSLVADRLARTNSRDPAGGLLFDYEIIDAQFGVQFNRQLPISVRLNLLRNLDADDTGDAARLDIIFGDSINRAGWEFGLAYQRIQQDAVLAAFNDDDWWFPTRLRGTTAWIAYQFDNRIRVKLAGFSERRDDLSENNERILLDLSWAI